MKFLVILASTGLLWAQNAERSIVLKMIDTKVGEGAEAKQGQKYTVHYTGTLRDGKQFDSSLDRKEPFEFVQGRRLVIAGWEAGFEGMKVGGRRRIEIPYQLAYGEKGSGPIPPKADLYFDVELLAVADAPAIPPGQDILTALQHYKEKFVKLAAAIPDDQWDWRPKPEVRSVAEIYLHVARGNDMALEIAVGGKPTEAETLVISMDKTSSLRALEASVANIVKRVEAMRNGTLAREVNFFGTPTTTRGALVLIDAHMAEHLGQLIVYARSLGITPPWSN